MKTRLSFLVPFICLMFGGLAPAEDADVRIAKRLKAKAEQGDAEAQVSLGHRYGSGLGVTSDEAEAVKWYRKAAEQGNVTGQKMLGMCYEGGLGVTKDIVSAHAWLSLASAGGDEIAKKWMSTGETKMTPEQIAEATKLARALDAKIKK